jgi:hypothetical protein
MMQIRWHRLGPTVRIVAMLLALLMVLAEAALAANSFAQVPLVLTTTFGVSRQTISVNGTGLPANQSALGLYFVDSLGNFFRVTTCPTDASGTLVGCTFAVPRAVSAPAGDYTVEVANSLDRNGHLVILGEACFNRGLLACVRADADANPHVDSQRHAYSNAQSYADSDADGDRHRHAHGDSH